MKKKPELSADVIIREYFDAALVDTAGRHRERVKLVESSLREFLEHRADHMLIPREVALLEAERQFDPNGAFCRVASAETLLFSFWFFLHDEGVPTEREDRRLRLKHVEGLIVDLLNRRAVVYNDYSCQLLDLDREIREQRKALAS